MWNNRIVGEELACEHENTGNTRGTITSKSHAIFYMKHKSWESKILVNQSVICQIHQSFMPPTLPTLQYKCV